MKNSQPRILIKRITNLASACITLCFCISSCSKDDDTRVPILNVSTLATGFTAPSGLEIDVSGRVWVTEAGTGNNDGKVSVIAPDGRSYPVITNFSSSMVGGDVSGPSRLLFADGLLYILGDSGKLYKADVSAYKTGDASVKASTLGVENIGAAIIAFAMVHDTNESHPYALVAGPDGAIYIADAAANAIIKRARTGAISVLAEVPAIANTLPVGPPMAEAVPTGIIWDGQNFLVTAFIGFPFPAGKSLVYKVSPTGVVSIYQQGFNSLIDISDGTRLGHLVLEHGTFGAIGFAAKTGRLVWADGTKATPLADGLNLPTGLKQSGEHTWYVTSLGDKSVLKVTY